MLELSARFMVGMFLSATILIGAEFAPGEAASVTGDAVIHVGDGLPKIVSVSASSVDEEEGTATGHIVFQDPAAMTGQDVDGTGDPALVDSPTGVRLEANVDCLYVEGNQAAIGGQVTAANVGRYLGMWVLLFLTDDADAADGNGSLGWGFYPAETDIGCGTFPLVSHDPMEIRSGSFTIQQ